MKDVQIEAVIRQEFARKGFPTLHIMELPDLADSDGRAWVVTSADPDDKREVDGHLKNAGVSVYVSALEITQNRRAKQLSDLLSVRSQSAAMTLRALLDSVPVTA